MSKVGLRVAVMVVEEGIAARDCVGFICCNNGEYYEIYVEASKGKKDGIEWIDSN